MDSLSNDIKSIVHRYIHTELLNDVNKEYHTKFAVHWSNNLQGFFININSDVFPIANWRSLRYRGGCLFYYIYNMYSRSFEHVAYIPKNY